MVWHFTICSVVWMLELSKVGCEDLASSENKSTQSFFKTPFWYPFQNRKPDPKVCGERTWLPIYKMVWHLTIGSAVWMLELSKVGCKDFASFSEEESRRGGHFGSSPLMYLMSQIRFHMYQVLVLGCWLVVKCPYTFKKQCVDGWNTLWIFI